MSTALEARLVYLEMRDKLKTEQIAALQKDVAKLKRDRTAQQTGGFQQGGGGGDEPTYWTVGDGLGGVATGTWPTLTPYTFTADVYKFVGATQTLVASGASVNWPYKDAMSTTAGKLVPLTLNDDGTSYDALEESCTVVT